MPENKTPEQLNEELATLRLAFLHLRESVIDELASLHVETDAVYRASLELFSGRMHMNQLPEPDKNRLTNFRSHLERLKSSYVDELRGKLSLLDKR